MRNNTRPTPKAKAGIRAAILPYLTALVLLCAIPAHAQTPGTTIPSVPGQWFDNSGAVCSACLLYSYTSGTTTPLTTYSDSALSVANANPVVLDSAGRATVFLSASTYKFVLKTSGGTTLWTRDGIGAVPYTTIASSFNATCDGLLTLTTSTPVTSADVTAATTVYFTPYKGNRCALYDGSQWNLSTFTEKSIALGADTANTNNDVFIYLSAGTVTIERVAWTNDTTRATSITYQDGVYVKSSDTTKRYVGTYRTTAAAGQTEDSAAKRFVWNYLHRVPRSLVKTEATDSWTYTTATYRQGNNSTANQVALVVGVAESAMSLRLTVTAANSTAGVGVVVAIGEDSTTTPLGDVFGLADAPVANYRIQLRGDVTRIVAIGYHYYAWLEYSSAVGVTTWYGDGGASTLIQSGLTGWVMG